MTTPLLLTLHAATTFMMTGLIWLIQRVHYPLMAQVGEAQFAAYHQAHSVLITPVVFPLMTVELVTAGLLVMVRPEPLPAWSVWLGLALVGAVWLSTAFLQVPAHGRLGGGFVPDVHAALVTGNWVRTLAWSARSALVAWWMVRLLGGGTGGAGA